MLPLSALWLTALAINAVSARAPPRIGARARAMVVLENARRVLSHLGLFLPCLLVSFHLMVLELAC